MKRRILTMLLAAMVMVAASGCGSQKASTETAEQSEVSEEASEAAEEEAADEDSGDEGAKEEGTKTFESSDGWSVSYDSSLIACNEMDGGAGFVYTGESAGTNMYIITYVPDKQPEEALTAATEDTWSDQEDVIRSEGYFNNNKDIWSFTRKLTAPEGGSELRDEFTAFEYNGGVMLIEEILHISDDEEIDNTMFDALESIPASMQFKDFKPQSEYSYVPGTYKGEGEEGTVVLNDDHTGVLKFQDDIDVIWESTKLVVTSGDYEYEYTIEGDNLLVNYDDTWLTFVRK